MDTTTAVILAVLTVVIGTALVYIDYQHRLRSRRVAVLERRLNELAAKFVESLKPPTHPNYDEHWGALNEIREQERKATAATPGLLPHQLPVGVRCRGCGRVLWVPPQTHKYFKLCNACTEAYHQNIIARAKSGGPLEVEDFDSRKDGVT